MGYWILILEKYQELNRIISPHNEYVLYQTGLTGIKEGGKGVGGRVATSTLFNNEVVELEGPVGSPASSS